MAIELTINGDQRLVDVPKDMPLLWVIRDELGLTGTKFGCGAALCGACTVHLDGVAIRACVTPVGSVNGEVQTIEGSGEDLEVSALKEAWLEEQVPQCGYCQIGQIMNAAALLKDKPQPSVEEINEAMTGNLCRCGCYTRIRQAIQRAGQSLSNPEGRPA